MNYTKAEVIHTYALSKSNMNCDSQSLSDIDQVGNVRFDAIGGQMSVS